MEHHGYQNLVNYQSKKIWLWRSPPPPTRTHTSCKLMSNVIIDLPQACQLCKPSICVWLDWQLSKSVIRWQLLHDHLGGSDERSVVLPLHISWYNMSLTKLRSIDSCQNGTCVDHYQKTNNVGSGPLRWTIWHFAPTTTTSRTEMSYSH